MASVTWLREGVATWAETTVVPVDDAAPAEEPNREFLGAPEILRSLILFNLLFAVQTVLDLIFLWGNAGLPAGISYADYAHRGAYPLIATALLAAAFVLVAMRPGGPAEKSPVIRPLVYVFVAQMFIASAIIHDHGRGSAYRAGRRSPCRSAPASNLPQLPLRSPRCCPSTVCRVRGHVR